MVLSGDLVTGTSLTNRAKISLRGTFSELPYAFYLFFTAWTADKIRHQWVPAFIRFLPILHLFLAKSWPFIGSVWRCQICARPNFFHFSARSRKIWQRWPANAARFFSSPDWLFATFPWSSWSSPTRRPPYATSKSTFSWSVWSVLRYSELSQRHTH